MEVSAQAVSPVVPFGTPLKMEKLW